MFSDLTRWSEWNFGVTEALWVKGQPWVKGSIFKFVSTSGNRRSIIQPTILDCKPAEFVTWQGKTMTIKGQHTFMFEKNGTEQTKVTTKEEFSGALLPLISRFIKAEQIKETFNKTLIELKNSVENQTT